jgi:hypothetical protein
MKLMVEVNVSEIKAMTGKEKTTNIDLTEIIAKIRQVMDRIKEISGKGQPMDVKFDSFNFSVSNFGGEYTLTLNSKIAIKPKN